MILREVDFFRLYQRTTPGQQKINALLKENFRSPLQNLLAIATGKKSPCGGLLGLLCSLALEILDLDSKNHEQGLQI